MKIKVDETLTAPCLWVVIGFQQGRRGEFAPSLL